MCLCVCLVVWLSVCVPGFWVVCLFVWLFVCWSACLCACVFVCLFDGLFVVCDGLQVCLLSLVCVVWLVWLSGVCYVVVLCGCYVCFGLRCWCVMAGCYGSVGLVWL